VFTHGGKDLGHDLPGGLDCVKFHWRLQLDHDDNYTGITIAVMVRVPLTPADRERGERLGALLRAARGDRSLAEVAGDAGISAETLRKIETGRIPTPAFFTVSALAGALGLSLDQLVAAAAPASDLPNARAV
jgi:DNA-binding phage protein